MHRSPALWSLAFLLLAAPTRAEESTGALPMNDAYLREARLATRALEARDSAGLLGGLAFEGEELSPAEAMPVSSKEGAWIVWTFSTRATKDRDTEPAVRFVLTPRAGTLRWRSTLDTMGSWLEPEIFHIDDEFAVFSRRGPSLSEDVTAARDEAKSLVARLLGRTEDPGEDLAQELTQKGLATGVLTARKHVRHLVLEIAGEPPFSAAAVAQAYPLYWLQVSHSPEEELTTVAWSAPVGLAPGGPKDPREAGTAPDEGARARAAEVEARVSAIGLGLVNAWKEKPGTDAQERRRWVEEAGARIAAEYEKGGVLIPGSNRHEIDMFRFARYLGVMD